MWRACAALAVRQQRVSAGRFERHVRCGHRHTRPWRRGGRHRQGRGGRRARPDNRQRARCANQGQRCVTGGNEFPAATTAFSSALGEPATARALPVNASALTALAGSPACAVAATPGSRLMPARARQWIYGVEPFLVGQAQQRAWRRSWSQRRCTLGTTAAGPLPIACRTVSHSAQPGRQRCASRGAIEPEVTTTWIPLG